MFLSKCTLKNIYNTPQICSDMLKIAPKALHLKKNGTPPPPFRTFPAASHLVYYSTKNIATFIDSLLVYISQMYLQV